MVALAIRHVDDFTIVQIDCQPPAPLQITPVCLEPLRPAGSRQPAVGNHHINALTGGGQFPFGKSIAGSRQQQVPVMSGAADHDVTKIGIAACARPLIETARGAAHPRQLQQGITGIAFAPLTQHQQFTRHLTRQANMPTIG